MSNTETVRPRIILVEDHDDTLAALAFFLRKKNYDVIGAHHFPDATDIINANSFDLLITDIMLPAGSGYEILDHARAKYPDVPSIAMSARGMAQDREMAQDAGFDRFLTKPFAMPDLLREIESLLKLSNSNQQS